MDSTPGQTGATGEIGPRLPFFAKLGGGDSRAGAALMAILIATAIVYCRSLGNGFVFDDSGLFASNRYIGDWSFIWKSLAYDPVWYLWPGTSPVLPYYRPLQNIWFAFNFHLFGLNPIGWHATMIALHLLAVWLVFRAAWLLAAEIWTALLAAALFALMPIHVSAVAYASAIGTPLSAAFEFGAFLFYLQWWQTRGTPKAQPNELAASLALFAGALLSYDGAACVSSTNRSPRFSAGIT